METERLILRPYEENDLADYYRILSDRGNLYYLDDIVTETPEDALTSLREAIALMDSGDARRFAIVLKNHPRIIGGVGYDITDKTPLGRIGHMGWFLLPEFQNKGYITEAARRILAYAFEEDNCIKITTGCFKENIPTQKVMAKLGFVQETDKINTRWHDGKMKERLEFAITPS
ncbi:MAG: GNAT family N-acetyltransferase [Defluviitaleaceae bacterium]|nr:GNAT family N-acetyltransferase [Defluviitaleaceae bacterium]